jgi:AbrB family looped-hinge helix DNA binding protein
MKLPKGKKFYGVVTVSERGQIVIPAEARRDFGIEVGDKLIVAADLEKGIGLAKTSVLMEALASMLEMFKAAPEVDGTEE